MDQIEAGALDSTSPLADVLRKCVALGGRSGSEELRDWARRELDGYADGGETLPAYRTVRGAICIDGADLAKMVTGQQISTFQLPDFARDAITEDVPIPYGVAELEKLAASKHALQLQHPHMQDVVLYMNSQADFGTSIHSMYWRLSPTRIHGILDTIRTNLVALMAEMRASGATEFPSPEVADQAVNVVVHGAKRSTITVNTNQMTGPGAAGGRQSIVHAPSPHDSKLPDWIRAPWAIVLGLATVAAGIAGVAVWVGWNPFS